MTTFGADLGVREVLEWMFQLGNVKPQRICYSTWGLALQDNARKEDKWYRGGRTPRKLDKAIKRAIGPWCKVVDDVCDGGGNPGAAKAENSSFR